MMNKPAKSVLVFGVMCGALGAPGALFAQTAVPPPSTERTESPYDRNPACRDREVASTDPACVIRDLPRQFNFDFNSTKPKPVAPGQPPQENAAPPAVIVAPPQSER